jgi:hypothetical protein
MLSGTVNFPARNPSCLLGLDHRSGQARAFFPARQELAVAQTACRAYKNALAWPALHTWVAETMIKAVFCLPVYE